jgi:protein-S-isoprenylcysteine O-methyltransferase Ste14
LLGAFIVAVHHRIVLAEEGHLRYAFGEEYAGYCRRVGRYL